MKAIVYNNDLYEVVATLRSLLEQSNVAWLSEELADALLGSTAGEVLGELGLVLERIRAGSAYRLTGVAELVDASIEYIDRALGAANKTMAARGPVDTTHYGNLLASVRDHLRQYGVPDWPSRLEMWLRELDALQSEQLKDHILRTRRALGGKGSIGEITICRAAGHTVSEDVRERRAANDRLMTLVRDLYIESARLLHCIG